MTFNRREALNNYHKISYFLILFYLIFSFAQTLEIGQSNHIKLVLQNKFQYNETIIITQQKLDAFKNESNLINKDTWFAFIDIQPSSEVTWPDIYLTIFTRDINDKNKVLHKKDCSKQGIQLETCYISSDDFDYKNQELIIKIATDEEASLLLESQLIMMKKVDLNSCNKIDSSSLIKKDSKLFKINVSEIVVPFQQIRVTLTPINKIYSGEAIQIYATFGKFYPIPQRHQKKSHYAWEMGTLLQFFKAELTETKFIYLLIDYPQNYLFDLDVTLIEDYKGGVQLKTGQFSDEILGKQNPYAVYIITVSNPELNNYIRIKHYFGQVVIDEIKVLEFVKEYQDKSKMTYLKEFNNQIFLDSSKFKIEKGIKKLQLKIGIHTITSIALFTIETYENSKNYNWINEGQAHLSELIEDQKTIFLSRVIRHKSEVPDNSQASINILSKHGAITERMFICLNNNVDQCVQTAKNYSNQTSAITVSGILEQFKSVKKVLDEIAQVKTIQIVIGKKYFVEYTQQYKQAIILIEVSGQKQYKENVFSIEFLNVGIMDTISEHQSKEEIVDKGEFKIYRFTMPNDTNTKSLVFHITTLNGLVQRFVTTQNPTQKSQQQLENMTRNQPPSVFRMYENSIEVQKVQPMKEYYLVILGFVKSLIRVKVQLKTTMTHPLDQTNITYSFVYINTLNSFQFVFQPDQLIIFDLSKTNLTQTAIYASAPLPLDSCIVIAQGLPDPKLIPIQPKCTLRETIGKIYENSFNIGLINQRFSVYNGNNESVPLAMRFENFEECKYHQVGQKQIFYAGLLSQLKQKQICAKFAIYRKGPLLVSVKSMNPQYKYAFKYEFFVGDGDSQHLKKEQTIIEASDVDQGCNSDYQTCFATLKFELNDKSQEYLKKIKEKIFLFQLQYIDQPIDLIDGSLYTYTGAVTNQAPIQFKYGIYNLHRQISIILENQIGLHTVLAKILPMQERHVFPTIQERDQQISSNQTINQSKIFQANNDVFYIYDYLVITKEEVLNQCHPNITQKNFWNSCILLISIYPFATPVIYELDRKFTIELIQYTSMLKQRHVTPGYVEAGMLNSYQIKNTIENATLVVYVNTNVLTKKTGHLYCLEGYLQFSQTKGTSQKAHKNFEKGSSQIILSNAKKGNYFFTIKGLQTSENLCQYTIQYLIAPPSKEGQTVSPIKTLKKSTPTNIKMSQNVSQNTQFFFYFNDAQKTNFKIVTLFEKLGEVLISVMPLPTDQSQKKIFSDILQIDTIFKGEWKDSNSLEIRSDDKSYCSECVYLIKVQCIKDMEGKIIIPEEGSQIAIKSNSMLYDQMLKGQKSFYRVFTDSHLTYKLNVISGEISLKVKGKKQTKLMFQKNYTSSDEQKIEIVELKNNQTYDRLRYELIEVQCLKDTHFLFGFLRNSKGSNQNSTGNVKPNQESISFIEEWIKKPKLLTYGVPMTVFIMPEYIQCVTGPIEEDPVFIFSVNPYLSQSISMQRLKYDFYLRFPENNTNQTIPQSNLDVKQTSKSKVIKIIDTKQIKKYNQSQTSFLICMSNFEKISVDVIQSSHVNYLAPNTEILVHESMNLTFMAEGDNIIQINECSGRSLVSISRDFGSVHSTKSEVPQIRKGNSLIEFKRKGPVYLSAQTNGLMTLNWRDVNIIQGKNVGYFMYEPSSFRILPNSDADKKMTLKISPLNEIQTMANISKEKRPVVESLSFEIYVQKQEQQLYEAMNCHKQGGLESVQKVEFNPNAGADEHYILQFYTKSEIQVKFPETSYVLVAVKAILQMKNQITGEKQQYRFFYPYQQLMIVTQENLQKVSQRTTQQQHQISDQPITISLQSLLIVGGVLLVLGTLIACQYKQIRRFIRKVFGKDIVPAENHFQLRAEISSASDSFYQKAKQ